MGVEAKEVARVVAKAVGGKVVAREVAKAEVQEVARVVEKAVARGM
jgi:hypothetical protein